MDDKELCEILNNIYLLPQLFRKVGLNYENFKGHRKTFNYHLALLMLKEHEKLSISKIGNLIGIKKQNMTYVADKLAENGLVMRIPDMNDRRVVNITITDKGNEYLNEWQKNKIEEINRIFTYSDSEDFKKFYTSLENIKCVLSKIEND